MVNHSKDVRPMRNIAVVVLVGMMLGVSPHAIEVMLDRRSLQEAIDIGNTRIESTRARIHAEYRFDANQPPVDYIDVVTPFYKVVLASESQARTGGKLFGQSEAFEALGPEPSRVGIYVELTFHPLNTFVGVPPYTVTLASTMRGPNASKPLDPVTLDRSPRFGPRLEGIPRPFMSPQVPSGPTGSGPLSGGTLAAMFDGEVLDPKGTYDAMVKDGDKEIARVRIDFGRLR
jgi:hypothetical protein